MRRHLPLIVLFITLGFVTSYLLASPPRSFQEKSKQDSTQKKSDDKKSESKADDSKKQDQTANKQDGKSETKSGSKSDGKNDSKTDGKKSDGKTGEVKKSDPDHPVTKMLAEWKTMREALVKAKQKYDLALVKKERDDARKEFMTLYEKGNEFIKKIKDAAIERIKKDSKDEPAIRALCGIMINAANSEDDPLAFEIAEKMFEANVDVKYFNTAKDSLRLSMFSRGVLDEALIRQAEKLDNLPRVKFTTDKGDIVVELFENQAPDTVGNFIFLVKDGFFNGTEFHRVMKGFMAQAGKAPKGKKELDYKIYCECTKADARLHFTGSLSMAHAGRDTGSSEFFLTLRRTSNLDRNHTVFGRVVEGMDVLKKITITYDNDASAPGGGKPLKDVKADLIKSAVVLRESEGRQYKPNKVGSDQPEVNPPVEAPKGGDKKKEAGSGKKADDKKPAENKKVEDKRVEKKADESGDKKASDKNSEKKK